jgi:2'-5' RNA ligase
VSPIGRAFVAVVPPPEVLEALEHRLAPVARDVEVRWMRRDQLHFTLQFLGRVDDERVLSSALADVVSAEPVFTARLAGSGAFPSARRARVLWVGVSEGGDGFGALARAVREATGELGFTRDDKPFTAHMTVARSSRPRPMTSVIDSIDADPIGPSWRVEEALLFESDTRPDGAVHSVRERLELRGASKSEPDR